ncbi:hypothetical protein M569_03550 [Genlisea aurea]|uniref:PAZ domain-containing protein n=1 Tax=Genlisea aurea TaxID=192259 RepID=S8CV12_9LAMI|nr:hypothetical protein M569_03550 [Genlisea aurea]
MEEGTEISNRPLSSRPGFGTSGNRVSLVSNHFKVSLRNTGKTFYQYQVSITYDDNRSVESELVRRKVIDKLCQIYSTELSGEVVIYDGGKSLYSVGPLRLNNSGFTVVLERSIARRSMSSSDSKRSKFSLQSTTFMVSISYAAKIPLQCINVSLQGSELNKVQDFTRVLNTLLRQQAAKRGCLLVRQSCFDNDSKQFTDIGGGATAIKGLHSSFYPTLDGLTLNIDVSTTMIVTPGPVIDFLLASQNVKEAHFIDWVKAKKILKNLRIKAEHTNMEFKVLGLSDKPCYQQTFSLKAKSAGIAVDGEELEITVYDYFAKHHNIELRSSAPMPCLDVGKPKKSVYLPIELCSVLPAQRYKRPLSTLQRQALVEKSRQRPPERVQIITDAVRNCCYDEDPILVACDVSIEKHLAQVDGRVLNAPKVLTIFS